MPPPLDSLAHRVRQIRLELYGEDGLPPLAEALGVPAGTWANYELGVVMPAQAVLGLIVLTGADPNWLLTGSGPRFSGRQRQGV